MELLVISFLYKLYPHINIFSKAFELKTNTILRLIHFYFLLSFCSSLPEHFQNNRNKTHLNQTALMERILSCRLRSVCHILSKDSPLEVI